MIKNLDKSKPIFIDFETTIDKVTIEKALVASLYQEHWDDAQLIYLPDVEKLYQELKDTHIVAHNLSFDIHIFGWHLERGHFKQLDDTMLMAMFALPQLKSHSLLALFNHFSIKYDNTKDTGKEFDKEYKNLKMIYGDELDANIFEMSLTKKQKEYAKLDTYLLARVYNELKQLNAFGTKNKVKDHFAYKLNMKCLELWATQAKYGVPFVKSKVQKDIENKMEELNNLTTKIPVNINSPKQVKTWLNTLDVTLTPDYLSYMIRVHLNKNIEPSKIPNNLRQSTVTDWIYQQPFAETKSDEQYEKLLNLIDEVSKFNSTNTNYLAYFRHIPEVLNILEARSLYKLINTYLKKFNELSDMRYRGRIAPTTKTGRARSDNENLQNIPREFKSLIGFEGDYKTAENLIISADFAQLELRTISALAPDKDMVKAFRDYRDLHSETARKMFGENFTDLQRKYSKVVTFGTLYIGGANVVWIEMLKNNINVSLSEVRKWQQDWLKSWPGVASWHERCKREYQKSSLTKIPAPRYVKAQRLTDYAAAQNQGFGALVSQLAVTRLYRNLDAIKLPYKVVNFIHDDIWVEIPNPFYQGKSKEEVEQIFDTYASCFTKAYQDAWIEVAKVVPIASQVPMPVEVEFGTTLKDIIYTYEDKDANFWYDKFETNHIIKEWRI